MAPGIVKEGLPAVELISAATRSEGFLTAVLLPSFLASAPRANTSTIKPAIFASIITGPPAAAPQLTHRPPRTTSNCPHLRQIGGPLISGLASCSCRLGCEHGFAHSVCVFLRVDEFELRRTLQAANRKSPGRHSVQKKRVT